MNLSYSDIRNFIELLATTHPLVGHDVSDPKKIRFYGYNAAALDAKARSVLNFDTLVMGLKLPNNQAVSWNYNDTGTSTRKQKYFEIVVLGKFKEHDFDAEDIICENAEKVLDEIESFLERLDAGDERCDYPIAEYILRQNITCARVSNIGVAALSGAVMRLPFADFVIYDEATNPFQILIS